MRTRLVEQAREGDDVAFSGLVDLEGDQCYAIAYRILRDVERAQDAVQQAFLLAWRDLPRLRDAERFGPWLHRLLVNACYREARRAKQRQVVEVHMTAADARGDGDAQDRTAMRDQLERGFRRLTPEQRAVLVVHHYLGLPDAEAAIVLEIAVGTFKSRLNRASTALRAALEADERTPTVATESIA